VIQLDVGRGEVGDSVTVEVADGNVRSCSTSGVALGGLEGTVAIAQQDTHCAFIIGVGPPVCHGKVGYAVAVKVPDRHGAWIKANGVALGDVHEGTVTLA